MNLSVTEYQMLRAENRRLMDALKMCAAVFGNQLGWETVRAEHPIIKEAEDA